MKYYQKTDARRLTVQQEICEFLQGFLSGEFETEQFRATFDRKTRTDWDAFGLKGMSGAMFLNMLVKHIQDTYRLAEQLRLVLALPQSVEDGRGKMQTFQGFLEELIETKQVERRKLQLARMPFLVSAFWHVQNTEQWPIFYVSARRTLESEKIYTSTTDPTEDYFAFREAFLALAKNLGLRSWDMEHLCVWYDERPTEESLAGEPDAEAAIPDFVTPSPDRIEDFTHVQIQWMLARIGKKLGCKIWIASNDRNKEYKGERLGAYSIEALPRLGLDPESQGIVELIDILWLQGTHRIVAAFEVEHSTSIYSGLLRLSDLTVLSPNINFPLYIVTSEDRLQKVRRELSRPTFQTLELHERCGFFSYEDLMSEAENIMSWASTPSVIDKLAKRVHDVE